MGGTFTGLVQDMVVLLVLGSILTPFLPGAARRAVVRLRGRATGLALRLAVGLLFTLIDSVITGALAAYHIATARLYLVPEDWLAFAQRASDRVLRGIIHG